MKKSLSLLLSIALVFGLFASMASAAETAALTTKEKYDQLVKAGVLKGEQGSDGRLNDNLTRAEFATIAIALAGLPVETTGNSFTDVTAKQWWYGAIEAAAKAKLVEGYNGKFNPADKVTVEEVIKVAATIAKIEPVKDAKVEGASDWAGPYIKAALDKGLIAAGLNYKANATRGQTIEVGYPLYVATLEPAKASITSAKPTNVNEVVVVLDKAVDTAKATVTLKRGTGAVATTTTWSEDKKTATLALTSSKIAEADYTVTLGGLAADEIGTATASFKGENEKITKLEFATTSDDIALTTAARIKLRAENQYGKLASSNSANFTVSTDAALAASLTKDSEGYLVLKLNTEAFKTAGATPGLSQIPVYVYSNDNHITAFKTFKLGFAPFISKSEVGEVKYDNGKKALVNKGDTATADIKLLDQYGNPVTVSQNLNPVFNHNVIIPYTQDVQVAEGDFDNDDEYEVRITLTNKTDKAQSHSLTLYVGSSGAQIPFEVGTSKVATTVEFESFEGTLAQGDTGKYVVFNAYDANGDKLTPQEIADNVKLNRFTVTASGVNGNTASIVTVGPNKGKIALPEVTTSKGGFVFVTLSILSPNANSLKTSQIPVNEKRKPDSLSVSKKPHVKAVLGADSAFKIVAKDQYGDNFDTTTTGYQIKYVFTPDAGSGITITGAGGAQSAMVNSGTTANLNAADEEYTFDTTAGLFGGATLKATLQKDGLDVANPVVVSIEAIDPSKTELNYSIGEIASLYASIDNGSLFNDAVKADFLLSHTRKAIALTVKDNAGNSVAYPDNIRGIQTSSSSVAQIKHDGLAAYVVGNKAGEATVTATVYKANGETATLTAKVTVKNDAVVADKIVSDGNYGTAVANGANLADLMNVVLTDNYGIEYNDVEIQDYWKLLGGVSYTVSEFTNINSIQIDANTGVLTQFAPGAGDYQFVVTATAANGKTTSTIFHNKG